MCCWILLNGCSNELIHSFYYKMVTCAPTMATILINFFCSNLLLSPNNQLRRVHCTLGSRGFSRARREFSVLAEGRHILVNSILGRCEALGNSYRFILNIFTHIRYIIGEGEIKTGNARFHALIQVDLHSFGRKHSQFREYFILN